MSKFRRLVAEITDLLDEVAPVRFSREVGEDATAQELLRLFARGVLKWRTL